MSIKNILPGKIGLGGAPLGNMFRNIPQEDVQATVSGAWDLGIRYFDTAPLYGSGLSEIRMGEVLSQYPRDEYQSGPHHAGRRRRHLRPRSG
mgnify:CR=1 FL=1